MTPFAVAGHIFLLYDAGSIQVYSSQAMARLHVTLRRYGGICDNAVLSTVLCILY